MILLCDNCEIGEHEKCSGLVDLCRGGEADCDCACRDKRKKVCPDCGDDITQYRPDCHSMPLGDEEEMTETAIVVKPGGGENFPFTLEDLSFWVAKRKDGTVVKYNMIGPPSSTAPRQTSSTKNWNGWTPSLSDWCQHNPVNNPIWDEGGVKIWIADSQGCKKFGMRFDTIMDCGNILNLNNLTGDLDIESNDKELADILLPYSITGQPNVPSVLKFAWIDRKAPPLKVEFWEKMGEVLKANTPTTLLTACQGGHGRSGTSLVCLMMVLNEEYTPYDAICHLRAMHCPRAIESKEQHQYINDVGIHLGREGNVGLVEEVKDFKAAFLAITHPSAKKYQEELKAKATTGLVK